MNAFVFCFFFKRIPTSAEMVTENDAPTKNQEGTEPETTSKKAAKKQAKEALKAAKVSRNSIQMCVCLTYTHM